MNKYTTDFKYGAKAKDSLHYYKNSIRDFLLLIFISPNNNF